MTDRRPQNTPERTDLKDEIQALVQKALIEGDILALLDKMTNNDLKAIKELLASLVVTDRAAD